MSRSDKRLASRITWVWETMLFALLGYFRGRSTPALLRIFVDRSGNALVEAALVFPLLIILFFGVSELCEGFIAKRRVEAAAYTAADLVARLQAVNSTDLIALKAMIDETISPLPVATVGLVVTSVIADAQNATTVAWSDALGPGVAANATGSAIAIPSGLTLPNTTVILAQVRYTFHSTLSTLIVGDIALQAQAYQRPRSVVQVARY
jgi:Flp pilus assembly protein TadG